MSTEERAELSRRSFLGAVAASAALGVATVSTAGAANGAARRKPNVIFAFSDQHRWQSAFVYGGAAGSHA